MPDAEVILYTVYRGGEGMQLTSNIRCLHLAAKLGYSSLVVSVFMSSVCRTCWGIDHASSGGRSIVPISVFQCVWGGGDFNLRCMHVSVKLKQYR